MSVEGDFLTADSARAREEGCSSLTVGRSSAAFRRSVVHPACTFKKSRFAKKCTADSSSIGGDGFRPQAKPDMNDDDERRIKNKTTTSAQRGGGMSRSEQPVWKAGYIAKGKRGTHR